MTRLDQLRQLAWLTTMYAPRRPQFPTIQKLNDVKGRAALDLQMAYIEGIVADYYQMCKHVRSRPNG